MLPVSLAKEKTWSPLVMQTVIFALVAAVVMWWRWGGTVEDSQAYFDTARYLKGEVEFGELRAPFPYRIGVPGLVALIPFDTRATFAALNWLFVSGSAVILAYTMSKVFRSTVAGYIAGLMLIFSFSTVWFAPYLLVDPGSLFARSLFVMGIVLARHRLAQVAAFLAVLVREENILLLGWMVITRRISLLRGVVLVAAAGTWLIFVRWYLVPNMPAYVWKPSLAQLLHGLQDWKSLATIFATAGVVVPLAIAGWRRAPESLAGLKSLVILLVLPSIYAMLCVRIDGRTVWGLYPLLIPFAVTWCIGRFQTNWSGLDQPGRAEKLISKQVSPLPIAVRR